eukprot:365578-Chlamydomonas_euryale.AAC.14
MKLLTHNMLACHIKGVKNNYPFLIEATQVEARDADYNPGVWSPFIACMGCMLGEATRLAWPRDTPGRLLTSTGVVEGISAAGASLAWHASTSVSSCACPHPFRIFIGSRGEAHMPRTRGQDA